MRIRTSAFVARWALALAVSLVAIVPLRASDHADPINIFNRVPLEAGITDLFVFPDRLETPEEAQLVFILCVRRALTQSGEGALKLEPYTYAIHMDLDTTVNHGDEQSRFRYGGQVIHPESISEDVTLTFRFHDDASLNGKPTIMGRRLNVSPEQIKVWGGGAGQNIQIDPRQVNIWAGVADDPFIFPVFFETNVVAMVVSMPLLLFGEQQDWIVWANSTKDGEQIDHVGRSLRTQNPRFELLNTLHPRDQVAAIVQEHEHPSLMRDVFLRIGLNSTFGYREWDFVPDVMLFTRRSGLRFSDDEAPSNGDARFPNGRRLTDDVAERLARYGDALLKEISYIAGGWPRATTNDNGKTQPSGNDTLPRSVFPYLADPWPDKKPREPLTLTAASRFKLIAIALGILVLWILTAWFIAFLYHRRWLHRRWL